MARLCLDSTDRDVVVKAWSLGLGARRYEGWKQLVLFCRTIRTMLDSLLGDGRCESCSVR